MFFLKKLYLYITSIAFFYEKTDFHFAQLYLLGTSIVLSNFRVYYRENEFFFLFFFLPYRNPPESWRIFNFGKEPTHN